MKNLTKVFEGNEVKIEVIDGQPMFEIYSTGMALGYINFGKNKNRPLPHKSRIDKVIANAEISRCVHGVNTFMTESQLYDFMLEARTDKCKSFRRWVTDEVLPQIRKTGGYIPLSNNMDDSEIMARALMIADNTIKQKQELIDNLSPKAEGYDTFLNSKGYIDFQNFAKSAKLKVGRNKLMERLRKEKVLMSSESRKNVPYQSYVNKGLFKTIQVVNSNNFSTSKTVMTKSGAEWLLRKCKEWEMM